MSESDSGPRPRSTACARCSRRSGTRSALDAEVQVEQDEEGIRGVLDGDDLGLFIGRHGQTIDAVQHLAFKIANRDAGRGGVRVVVDAAGYRARREQALHRQADAGRRDAVRGGRPVALDAMSATERKVVHEHLKDRDDVETYSEGVEPDRHLVVAPLDRLISRETLGRGPAISRETPRGSTLAARARAAGAAGRTLAALLELQADDPTASTTVRDPARPSTATSPTRSSRSSCRRCARRGGSPTSARAPGGPGWRSRRRCPARAVALVESAIRHCRYLERAVERRRARRTSIVVHARAEEWPDGPAPTTS